MPFADMWVAMSWPTFLAMVAAAALLGGGMASSRAEDGDMGSAAAAFAVTFVAAFAVWLLLYWGAQAIWVGFEPLRTK